MDSVGAAVRRTLAELEATAAARAAATDASTRAQIERGQDAAVLEQRLRESGVRLEEELRRLQDAMRRITPGPG
jgi:hypothetical protein